MKKVLPTVILLFAMLAGARGDTSEHYEFTVSDGEATITLYTGPGGEVVIPSTLGGYPVVAIGGGRTAGAFRSNQDVTHVSIPDGVVAIEDWAFYECSNLVSVDLPDGMTSIGSWAFARCSSLAQVEMPDSVTTLGNYVFQDCTSLASVSLSTGITFLGGSTFAGCSSLNEIDIPDSVTYIANGAFDGCVSLTEVEIPAGVTHIGHSAFRDCISLTSMEIPDGVTFLGQRAFYGCTSLERVTLPESLDFIQFRSFQGCSSLTSVDLPASIETIADSAFVSCSNLASAVFRGDAPAMGTSVFAGAAPDFAVFYFDGAAGFTSPLWEGYPAINLGPTRPFTDWVIAQQVLSARYSGPADDLNGDGVKLLLAFALDLNPRENLAGQLPRPILSGGELNMRFRGDQPGVIYTAERSDGLDDWESSGVDVSEPDDEGMRTATVPADGVRSRFLRLVVEEEAP